MLKNKDIRKQFPILNRRINGKPLVYLDNAATTQKPQYVLDAIREYYEGYNANIHRSSHELAKKATAEWKIAHEIVANFVNANSFEEIVFLRNCTEGLNLIAHSYGRANLKEGDIVVISEMEHHSNIVPWQMLKKEIGFELKFMPITDDYVLDIEWLKELVEKEGDRVKIVSVVHLSNVLGTLNDVKKIGEIAHSVNALMVVDAAQSISHVPIDVQALDCDVLVISGHKVFAPTGSGALYCKKEILEKMNPFMGGGEMIASVSKEDFELNELPWRFEAGTPNIEGGIALAKALEWFDETIMGIGGWDVLIEHERELMKAFFESFDGIEWLSVLGTKDFDKRLGTIAFGIEGFQFKGCKDLKENSKEGEGVVKMLNDKGFALREGYHCAEPLHDRFQFGPTLRASFSLYNNKEEVVKLCKAIKEAVLASY